jgi:NADP-dependent 3-hydroxy acid dehydrogenase YdfG
MKFLLNDKWVLITGASSGFGAAAAVAFGAAGAKLLLGARRVDRLKKVSALPLMPRDAGASIINIGSVAGHTAYEGDAAYCAAKAGELQITRALRLELFGTGIRVGTVDSGLAETEFSLVRLKGDGAKAKKVYEGMNPLKAEDIAEILVWVASRPAHVNIDEILVKPVDQAAVGKVFRRSPK